MGSRSLKSSPFERAVLAVLKERLQSLDLTIDRLAERAGITRARCYKIFAGDTVCTMSDFDLDSTPATLRIERQVQYLAGEGPVELPPKSAAGVREIVIPASLVPALRAHLDSYVAPAGTAWLLSSERSPRQPLHPNSLRGAWERAREDAGIPWFKFHDLRHTGLTIFAQQGATLAELLHRGGHSDVDVALRYQHATRERDAALAARMDSHVLT